MARAAFYLALTSLVAQASAFAPRSVARPASALNAAALIVQNKGGGHGELGYQLAKVLESDYKDKIDSITILQDQACKDTAEPFKSYATDLPNVKVVKAPLGDDATTAASLQGLLGADARFDYVWDNASKNAEGAGKAVCDAAKSWGVKLFCYVSSAGMYTPKADGPFPMPEDATPVKTSAGQYLFEQYAKESGLPLVTFRPQYIYGPKANKHDYLDWYFDRLVRDLPLPIPEDGSQKVSLTHSADVAQLLASALKDEAAAIKQCVFNCGTDQLYSYDEVAHLCAEAAGIPRDQVKIEHYDYDLLGKGTFPFRMTNFYVAPDKAKALLGFQPARSLKDDLKWYFADYQARGGPTKKMSLVKDWEIVVGHKTPHPDFMGSVYDKYDPLIIDDSNIQELEIDIPLT